MPQPQCYIVAGPNGAGKTTFAREFLPRFGNCTQFLNADLIAQGLAPLAPETAALRAGRILLQEWRRIAAQKKDFGFESTLAGLGYVAWLRRLRQAGYRIRLYYLWLPAVDVALL